MANNATIRNPAGPPVVLTTRQLADGSHIQHVHADELATIRRVLEELLLTQREILQEMREPGQGPEQPSEMQ